MKSSVVYELSELLSVKSMSVVFGWMIKSNFGKSRSKSVLPQVGTFCFLDRQIVKLVDSERELIGCLV